MDIRFIIDSVASAQENMLIDTNLFQHSENHPQQITCRFYYFNDHEITHGYSQKLSNDLSPTPAKRPTGGGIVHHHKNELCISLISPKNNSKLPRGVLNLTKHLSTIIQSSLKAVNIESDMTKASTAQFKQRKNNDNCFNFASKYELSSNDKKIVGIAAKIGKNSIIQQCTIKKTSFDQSKFIQYFKQELINQYT
jgi:lipoate-protein ligase A